MKPRRCSALHTDLLEPLCAAMSSIGGGMFAFGAVMAEGSDRGEEEEWEELEAGAGVKWPPWRSISSFIAGGARRLRHPPLRDLRLTVQIHPPFARTNHGALKLTT